MKTFTSFTLLVLFVLAVASMPSGARKRGAPASQPKPPNIVFIMSDDHAAHAISAYGSRLIKTPNIDRLANEGMKT